MSVSTQTLQTLNGMFKVQYADKMANLVPEMAQILSKIPFVPNNQKAGSVYIQPVVLTLDQGFTCHGSNDQILSFNAPVGHTIAQAQVQSCVYSGRAFVSNAVLQRASGDAQSFVDATSHIVQSLSKSFSHMVEGIHWYGGSGLATVAVTTAMISAKILNVTVANNAAFLWLGGEGMPVDIYNATTGALAVSTEITFVDMNTGAAAGDGGVRLTIADVGSLADATSYVIYRKGFKDIEHKGIKHILNTNNIFGINGANYSLWKSNRYTASASLSYSLLTSIVAKSIGRGVTGPLMAYLSPKVFRQLFPDYLSLGQTTTDSTAAVAGNPRTRKFTAEEAKNLVHGTDSVKLSIDGIKIEFFASEFIKGGDCFLLDKETWIRVGSTGPTFNIPGSNDSQYFISRPDSLASEVRIICDEAPFSDSLNKNISIDTITGQ